MSDIFHGAKQQSRGGLCSSAGGVRLGKCEHRIRSSLPGPMDSRGAILEILQIGLHPEKSWVVVGSCFFLHNFVISKWTWKMFQSSTVSTRHPWMSCSPCEGRCTTLGSCSAWRRCTCNVGHCKKLFFFGEGLDWYHIPSGKLT